ncbi:MAG TPA: hypothetical protein VHW91_09145 [Candidatus Dormibacteraeota bacterium]|jgi:hypothetical protein|nr:hypothetical protein [Candidatus Dormibacteraeota bacterium]
MSEPEASASAARSGPVTRTPTTAGVRELKPPEWFEERLKAWVQRMGLGAWTIRTLYKPKLRGAEGYAKVTPSFLEAELEFRQDVLVERGDVVIVHELTHILTDDWAEAMQQVISDMVPKKLQREARNFLRPHEESVVEAIAHALVRTMQETEAASRHQVTQNQ